MIVLQMGASVFSYRVALPAHYQTGPGGRVTLNAIGKLSTAISPGYMGIHASYAVDSDGNGWNIATGQRTDKSLIEHARECIAPEGLLLDESGNPSFDPSRVLPSQSDDLGGVGTRPGDSTPAGETGTVASSPRPTRPWSPRFPAGATALPQKWTGDEEVAKVKMNPTANSASPRATILLV